VILVSGQAALKFSGSAAVELRGGRREGFLLGERSRVPRERRDARRADAPRHQPLPAAGRGQRGAVIHSTFCNLPFLSALIYVE